jgi:hypothetical protein
MRGATLVAMRGRLLAACDVGGLVSVAAAGSERERQEQHRGEAAI